MAERAVRVLYLAGSGRSGTTVLARVLGQLPGCVAAGEVRFLWERGVGLDHRCGCGEPFSACPVWAPVMDRVREQVPAARPPTVGAGEGPVGGASGGASGGACGAAVGRRLRARLRVLRLPVLLGRRALGRPAVPPHADDAAVAAVYRALADVTGAGVVVDSSKLPPYGLLLDGLPGVDVRVLHLVRDPRATAFSWLRRRQTRDTRDGALMAQMPVWRSSLLWLLWNLLTSVLWRAGDPGVLRVRYEDLVAAPRPVLERVAAFAGAPPSALPFVGGSPDALVLAPVHAVAGNPNRHDSGEVRLREDDEWRRVMPRGARALVTLLTLPGLLRLGVPVHPRGAGPAPAPAGSS